MNKANNNQKFLLPALAAGAGVAGLLYFLLRNKKPVGVKKQLPLLNKAECQRRKKLIGDSNVEYTLELCFPENREEYMGRTNIKFDLVEIADITIDFQKSGITGLWINDKEISNPKELITSDQIVLNKEFLVLGSNFVLVEFTNVFDKDDAGLIKIPSKEGTTVHTSACGYLPSLIFPCFDQPDLKCLLKMKVTIPNEWRVIANEKIAYEATTESSDFLSEDHVKHYKDIEFMKSKKIPIHDFGLMIGEFEQRKISKTFKTIPLSIYYRKSVEEKVNKHFDNIVASAFATLEFFFAKFGSKYPFSKLDLVYAPASIPAIEYPGCILFNESYLESQPGDHFEHTDLYLIVIHELIHMWFGNLVTCDYWDNIFIHESFANFISYVILAESIGKFKDVHFDADLYLLVNKATNSFLYSSLPSMHSVKFDMNYIQLTNLIFDPITYNKGEALLYYLYTNMGSKKFFDTLKTMISAKAWGNIDYKEFLGYFSEPERNELDRLVNMREPELFSFGYYSNSKSLIATQLSNFNDVTKFNDIEVSVYNLADGSHSTKILNIGGKTSAVTVDESEPESSVYIYNRNIKGYFIYKDFKENFDRVVANVDRISDIDLHSYFINLFNSAIINQGEKIRQFFELFLAVWPRLLSFAPKKIMKMARRVMNAAAESERVAFKPIIFNQLLADDRLEYAAFFLSNNAEEIASFKNKLLSQGDHAKQKDFKAFLFKLDQFESSEHLQNLLPRYKSLFSDTEYFTYRELFGTAKAIEENWTGIVLYRSGFHNLPYYKGAMEFAKQSLPLARRVALAKDFLGKIDKIAAQIPKFYVKHLINKLLPAERIPDFNDFKVETMLALGKVHDSPYIERALLTRIELISLFNK
jgi:hypothetical protein